MDDKEKKILLIDANSFIHRAFHALPPLKTKDGKPTGAIYGLTNTLLRVLKDENPNYVAAAFDTPKKTFRKELFQEYKAHRPKAPEELKEQILEAYNLFKNFGIKTVEKPGFEADDVLGTLVKKFSGNKKIKIIVLTGDLDALQLIEHKNVTVLVPQKGVSQMNHYNENKVMERFGVTPKQLIDYKGLAGDSSDNISGVPGIGPKTTQELLSKYGTVEGIYKKITNEKGLVFEKLRKNKEQAILSKKLATIKKDLKLNISLEDIKYSQKNGKLIKYLESLGFESLVKRLTPQKQKETLF
jgi:DNA polymerase-1